MSRSDLSLSINFGRTYHHCNGTLAHNVPPKWPLFVSKSDSQPSKSYHFWPQIYQKRSLFWPKHPTYIGVLPYMDPLFATKRPKPKPNITKSTLLLGTHPPLFVSKSTKISRQDTQSPAPKTFKIIDFDHPKPPKPPKP
jgi:hypothetical protein